MILAKGLQDLMTTRIVRLSFEELEIDPMMVDFDPLSGEAVDTDGPIRF